MLEYYILSFIKKQVFFQKNYIIFKIVSSNNVDTTPGKPKTVQADNVYVFTAMLTPVISARTLTAKREKTPCKAEMKRDLNGFFDLNIATITERAEINKNPVIIIL